LPAGVVAPFALVLAISGCGSSNTSSSPSTSGASGSVSTTTAAVTQAGSARIASFVVPASVQCGASSKTTVHIAYAVMNAARQEIAIDGLDVAGVGTPSGAVDAPVHCDGVPHTVALIAFDAQGARTSQVKYLNTLLPAG